MQGAGKIKGIAMPGSELGPGNVADDGVEDARQFILQVKQTVERCVAQGMDKAQMFRAIREEGLHPGAAFAVYKEIRDQNRGFFQEYYCMIDLKEQRKRLDRLIQAYRGGMRFPETATQPIATEGPDAPVTMEWTADQLTLQDWLSDGGDHQLAPTTWTQHTAHLPAMEQVLNYGLPVANAWPQQTAHLPAWEEPMQNHGQPAANGAFQEPAWPLQQQQAFPLPDALPLHNCEETVDNGEFRGLLVWPQEEVQAGWQLQQPAVNNGWCQGLMWPQHQQAMHLSAKQQAVANVFRPLTSSAGLVNDAMMDPSWSLSHGDPSSWQWQGQQAEPLNQWWRGASTNPSHIRNNGDRGTVNSSGGSEDGN